MFPVFPPRHRNFRSAAGSAKCLAQCSPEGQLLELPCQTCQKLCATQAKHTNIQSANDKTSHYSTQSPKRTATQQNPQATSQSIQPSTSQRLSCQGGWFALFSFGNLHACLFVRCAWLVPGLSEKQRLFRCHIRVNLVRSLGHTTCQELWGHCFFANSRTSPIPGLLVAR